MIENEPTQKAINVEPNVPFSPFSPADRENIVAKITYLVENPNNEKTATTLFTKQLLLNGRLLRLRLLQHNWQEELSRDMKDQEEKREKTQRRVFPYSSLMSDNLIELIGMAPYEIQLKDLQTADGPFSTEYLVVIGDEVQYRGIIQTTEDDTSITGLFDSLGTPTQPLLRARQNVSSPEDVPSLLANISLIFQGPFKPKASTSEKPPQQKHVPDDGLIMPSED